MHNYYFSRRGHGITKYPNRNQARKREGNGVNETNTENSKVVELHLNIS